MSHHLLVTQWHMVTMRLKSSFISMNHSLYGTITKMNFYMIFIWYSEFLYCLLNPPYPAAIVDSINLHRHHYHVVKSLQSSSYFKGGARTRTHELLRGRVGKYKLIHENLSLWVPDSKMEPFDIKSILSAWTIVDSLRITSCLRQRPVLKTRIHGQPDQPVLSDWSLI